MLISEQKSILAAFLRALAREGHVLTKHPHLLWQQMFNRLQWEWDLVKPVLFPALTWRVLKEPKPWLRLRNPYKESQALLRTLEGHTNRVNACAFSPDGRFILSGSSDNTLRLWDPATGMLLNTIHMHSSVEDCGFSPDGGRIFSGHQDNIVGIWDAVTGEPLHILQSYYYTSNGSCSFSPDGAFIVSSSAKSKYEVGLWHIATERFYIFKGHIEKVNTCAFSPDGRQIVSGSSDKTIQIWDTSPRKILTSFPDERIRTLVDNTFPWENHIKTLAGHTGGVTACVYSPDGQTILSGSDDQTLRLWNASTGELLHTLKGHTRSVTACAFSPDGRRLVSGSYDTTVRLWDADSGENLGIFEGHTGPVNECAFSPDGQLVVSASNDGTLRLWNADLRGESEIKQGHTGEVRTCLHSPDGRFWVAGRADRTIQVWDTESNQILKTLMDHNSSVEMCQFSADGKMMVSSGFDALVNIWDTHTWEIKHSLECQWEWTMSGQKTICAISRDGQTVSGASRMTIQLWKAASGSSLHQLNGHTDEIYSLDFSPDGLLLASASRDKTVRVWDTVSRQLEHILEGPDFSRICLFSPDGCWIVSAGGGVDGGYVLIWDVNTGELVQNLEGHTQQVRVCSFSPDGSQLASYALDGTLRIWDPGSGTCLHTLENTDGILKDLFFTPDGRLLTATAGNTLYIWDTGHYEVLTRLPLPGNLTALSLHPINPVIVVGDTAGNLFQSTLVGIQYGPIILTAVDQSGRLEIRCPACQESFPLQSNYLGAEVSCPNRDCEIKLKVNPFILKTSRTKE